MLSERSTNVISPAGAPLRVRSQRRIRLGPARIEIRSNESDFKGFRFFSEASRQVSRDPNDRAEPDFTLSLCNLNIDGPWPIQTLMEVQDKSYRAKKMAAGYYLTDHFGAPAYLVSRGRQYWIFAEDFEPILWPYAIKHLLTLYAIEHGTLHLKAAAVALEGQGALLVGRGGSGKTVLLTQLCQTGAQFLSNTHVLIEGQNARGIPTAMRVRPDEFFAPIIAAHALSPSVKAGEYTADPLTDLGWEIAEAAPVRTVCVLDYKGARTHTIREIDQAIAFNYMEQFALAMNVYGLKEDIFDSLSAEVSRFSVEITRMRSQLDSLVRGARCYHLSCDAADPENLRSICSLLARRTV